MELTIAYTTARERAEVEWMLDSLCRQMLKGDRVTVILVDYYHGRRQLADVHGPCGIDIVHVPPKPNVWQGQHRLTKEEWWAKSAYINTAICLCDTEWISFVDDRSVLMPTWLAAVRRAMSGKYAVAGTYEKRRGMTVANGIIVHGGIIIGEDPRGTSLRPIPGSSWFGCTNALPVEWALTINGADESCDSLGMEDVIFGQMLERNGFPIKFDPDMKIVEDRSAEFYEAAVGRTDKGKSPQDKSHAILARTANAKTATHDINLRQIRERVLRGELFPIPTQPTVDWWDSKPLSEFP